MTQDVNIFEKLQVKDMQKALTTIQRTIIDTDIVKFRRWVMLSINQSIDKIHRSINQSINQSISQSIFYLHVISYERIRKAEKVKGSYACYSTIHTHSQQRFAISEVAADWHGLMIPWRIMRLSIARDRE